MISMVVPTSTLAGPALLVCSDGIVPSSLHTQDGASSCTSTTWETVLSSLVTFFWTSLGYGLHVPSAQDKCGSLSLEIPSPSSSFKWLSPQPNSHLLREASSKSPAGGGSPRQAPIEGFTPFDNSSPYSWDKPE